MNARGLPSMVVMTVLSCTAIACGVYVLYTQGPVNAVLIAAILSLALGQLFLSVMGWAKASSLEDELQGVSGEMRVADKRYTETFVAAELFETEIADLKRRASRVDKDMQDVKVASRDQFQEMSQRYETASANRYTPPETSAPPEALPKDHLNFLLQPIIDLTTNETVHYRTRFNMSAASGSEIDFEKLIANADRGGLRATLDVHVVNQAIPLLRRLRTRNPAMKMFLPIGAATLMRDTSLDVITAALADAADVASGLVFEITHDTLGRLTESGIAGLARIARIGTTLAVSEASVAGLDLATLRQLGVKFIGIDAASVESGYGIATTWNEFAQVARGLQFQIMLTDIKNPVQAAASAQIARLVTGPYFAPPRRVKFNAGIPSRSDISAAA
jgi:EAL domain-containing protein (putative c-di-GMP-specific phosphodiesterase class I)